MGKSSASLTRGPLRPTKRNRTVQRGAKFLKLKGLKCFQEVHERIVEGWTLSDVAKFIQEDRQEYTDISPASLNALLNDYRLTIPPAEKAARIPTVAKRAAVVVDRGLDELEEMQKLYLLQMERIQIDFGKEKMIGKLLPTMTQEVRTAREILQSFADLKMDLGLADRHLGSIDVNAQLTADITARYGKASVAGVIADPDSRRKVLSIAEKMLQLGVRRDVLGAPPPPPVEGEAAVLEMPSKPVINVGEDGKVELELDEVEEDEPETVAVTQTTRTLGISISRSMFPSRRGEPK